MPARATGLRREIAGVPAIAGRERVGQRVRIRFGPFQFYVLNSPDAIRQALVGQARNLEKGLNFGRAKRLIGNGLVMSEGENHRRQRRLMQPAFHRGEVARYLDTMRDVAVPRISAWPAAKSHARRKFNETVATCSPTATSANL